MWYLFICITPRSTFTERGIPVRVPTMVCFLMTYQPRGLPYLTVNKRLPNFSRVNQEKKQSTNIKCDEINIMNIIKDNTFNLHNSLLNNDNRYMKVTLKSKVLGFAK